jgi:diaminohydroxyphosphoribosylaminopyrimidine deaminase/5-amino-6-(5-phosphoribosylamino)uracil reductase
MLECRARGTHLDPDDILAKLGAHGLTRIFCEGGSALAASLIEADLVDQLIGFTAGLTIGAEGLPSVGALGLA